MKKVVSVQFNYEDGDSVKVLAKTETEEQVFSALRQAVTGNREKWGNIKAVSIGIEREKRDTIAMAGLGIDIMNVVAKQCESAIESMSPTLNDRIKRIQSLIGILN